MKTTTNLRKYKCVVRIGRKRWDIEIPTLAPIDDKLDDMLRRRALFAVASFNRRVDLNKIIVESVALLP